MIDLPIHKKIILFDGVCNLCNNSVLQIIKRDKNDVFVFASIQSNVGNNIINHLKIDTEKFDSIILYEPNISYEVRSTAVLKIMIDFGSFSKIIAKTLLLIPAKIRDTFYKIIAKNRYKWFGKKSSCMIPTPKLKAKFLE